MGSEHSLGLALALALPAVDGVPDSVLVSTSTSTTAASSTTSWSPEGTSRSSASSSSPEIEGLEVDVTRGKQ